jgi:opacity protein-like surface antigen
LNFVDPWKSLKHLIYQEFVKREKAMKTRLHVLVLLLPAFLWFCFSPQLHADGIEPEATGTDSSASAQPQERPSDFHLGHPRIFVGGHAGFNFPRADSDLFGMVARELTLEKSDFRAPVVGFDFGVPFQSHFAAVFSFEYARTSPVSESRNFVQDNGQPIRQTTHFTQMPIIGTLRFYPRKTGETVGSYAWIPTKFLPYVGGGAGVIRYQFTQSGDFVDSKTLDIFSADFRSSGVAATAHVVAGADIGLTWRIVANVEARYSFSHANLNQDFATFQPIDLTGLRISGGLFFRF